MRFITHVATVTFVSLSCLVLNKVVYINAFSITTSRPLPSLSRPISMPQQSSAIQMKKTDPRRGATDDVPLTLSAASDSVSDGIPPSKVLQGNANSSLKSLSDEAQNFLPVISAALLITTNTVGASMMALPDIVRGPGLAASAGIIGAVYAINLVSGLLIAEVGINQYEQSSCEVPSSFKEFADANLENDNAANFISCISLFINTCVLSFNFVRASEMTTSALITNETLQQIIGSEAMEGLSSTLSSGHVGLITVAAFFASLVATQSDKVLSGIASMCCITLFASFAGLVLPGLATIHDPIAVFTTAGTSEFGSQAFLHDVSSCVPVLLTAMIYQNIVPTVTKLLNYDRTQVVSAIALGSMIPMAMYISFCFTVIGGGTISGIGAGGIFWSGIKASSIFGSAMACVISIGEELNCYFSPRSAKELESYGMEIETTKEGEKESIIPYVLGVIPPVLVASLFSDGEGFVGALKVSGSYGSPLLYGIIPVFLALNQRSKFSSNVSKNPCGDVKRLVPGGLVPLMGLTLAAGALISTHFVEDVSSLSWLMHSV